VTVGEAVGVIGAKLSVCQTRQTPAPYSIAGRGAPGARVIKQVSYTQD